MLRVAVIGGAGYVGGELVRLLIGHPRVELAAVTSTSFAGRRLDTAHPNLRGRTDLRFLPPDRLERYDVLLLAVPHREAMRWVPGLFGQADLLIDLSADFRLPKPELYQAHYGVPHQAPELLATFTAGIPELHRETLRAADRISVPGCMATAALLALLPLSEAGVLVGAVKVDARTGSSGSGMAAGRLNQHAERSGAMRIFAPLGHRHEVEVGLVTGRPVRMTATGVEAVRGVQVLCRVGLADGVGEPEVRAAFRNRYASEPFVRVVAHRRGSYRYPEPKILLGSNYCDVGFAVPPEGGRAVLMAALDNLVKGGAGTAIQCLNIRYGWPEQLGLEFPGLHPI